MKLTRADCLRVGALVALALLVGHLAMKDDEAADAAIANDERAAMVVRAAEDACAGQVVRSAGRLRCAGPDRNGKMVASLIEVPR